MVPNSYKKLISENPKLEFLEWNQYYTHLGEFKINNVNISGNFSNKELKKCSEDISDFLDDYENLIDFFGTQVSVKLKKDFSIEIKEILRL